jgi:hypothetical protein
MRHSQLRLTLPTGETLVLGNQAFTGKPAEIHLSDENFFRRIVLASDIGLTESYMDGEWDSPDLRAVIGFFIENVDHTPGMSGSHSGKSSSCEPSNWTSRVRLGCGAAIGEPREQRRSPLRALLTPPVFPTDAHRGDRVTQEVSNYRGRAKGLLCFVDDGV